MNGFTSDIDEWLSDVTITEISTVVDTVQLPSLSSLAISTSKFQSYLGSFTRTASHKSLLNNVKLTHGRNCETLAGFRVRLSKLKVAYYKFNGDDKYFLVSNSGLLYTDSLVYEEFYQLLPKWTTLPKVSYEHAPGMRICLSRQQYGHFLYDDLIPFLVDHYSKSTSDGSECPPAAIYASLDWQKSAARNLASMIMPRLSWYTQHLPSETCLIDLSDVTVFLPVFPDVYLLWNRIISRCLNFELPHTSEIDTMRSVYLSRAGFEADPRVINRAELLASLMDGGQQPLIVRPHEVSLNKLFRILVRCKSVICEPGTTPLIAMLFSPLLKEIRALQPIRSLTSCSDKYFYSGWRYHYASSDITRYHWGFTVKPEDNPFSDTAFYPPEFLI